VKIRRTGLAMIVALAVAFAWSGTAMAQSTITFVHASDSNTTKLYTWSYPGTYDNPGYVYNIYMSVAYGTITTSYAVIKNISFKYFISSSSQDDVLVQEQYIVDNTTSIPQCKATYGNPGYTLYPGNYHNFTLYCPTNTHLYFSGGYITVGALAAGADGGTNTTLYIGY
jgi:hypothetical protein